jgi:hypothetical protein
MMSKRDAQSSAMVAPKGMFGGYAFTCMLRQRYL